MASPEQSKGASRMVRLLRRLSSDGMKKAKSHGSFAFFQLLF